MTANSQLISVKLVQGIIEKGFLIKTKKNQGISLPALDGDFVKRVFDIIFALLVLILLSPVYLCLGTIVAISSPGPVFYVQKRIGKNFKPLNCIKFRTMVDNADEVLETMMAQSPQMRQEFAESYKIKQDPRITGIGKFLRFTSLDEFPQFWNVLIGDMSVVGPRPLVPEEIHKYGRRIKTVLTIKPGITGLWQVSGRNNIPYPRRVLIDVYYATSHNWLLDVWIVIKTIGVIIFPRNNGAY